MKKLACFLICLAATQLSHGQMMKPSVMVVPSDTWCQENHYMIETSAASYPDYKKAIMNSHDLLHVISKINIIMSDRGFPLENLETALKNLNTQQVERQLYTAKDGSSLQEGPLDELYRAASADIILQLTWNVNKMGPKNSITFNLQALDSYTTKQVAGAQGTGNPSFSANVPGLLEEAVVSHMDVFCDRLMQHFVDTKEKGREISLDICLSETADCDFATEYDDYELAEVITGIIAKESVGHQFSRGPSTASMLQYKSIRIPVTDANGIPMDAYAFARNLARALKKAPYNLAAKVIAKGLGKSILLIGNE